VFRVAEILDGKGAGKKGRFQGKANKLQNRNIVEKLLNDFFCSSSSDVTEADVVYLGGSWNSGHVPYNTEKNTIDTTDGILSVVAMPHFVDPVSCKSAKNALFATYNFWSAMGARM